MNVLRLLAAILMTALAVAAPTHASGDSYIRYLNDHGHDITKDGVTATPCEVLYHELQHAADDTDNNAGNGPDLDDTCNGISQAEWRAVTAENAYRAGFGLPPRKSHNGKQFGSDNFGDCKKNQPPPGPAKKNHPTRRSAIRTWRPPRSARRTAPPPVLRFERRRFPGRSWRHWYPRWPRAAATADRVRDQGWRPDHHALDREQ